MVGVGVGRFRHLCYSPCWCCDRCSSRGRWLLSLSQALSLTTTVSGMQNFHVPNPVVVLTPVVVPVVSVVPVVLVPVVRSVVPGVLGPAGCTPVGSTHAPS